MHGPSDNDRLRRIFDTDQQFGQIAEGVRRWSGRFRGPLVLGCAWAIPIFYAITGITMRRGGGHIVRPAPVAWNAALAWAGNTLWIGAAVLAAVVTVLLACSTKRRGFSRAAAAVLLVETVWTATALVFVTVIANALVMAR